MKELWESLPNTGKIMAGFVTAGLVTSGIVTSTDSLTLLFQGRQDAQDAQDALVYIATRCFG